MNSLAALGRRGIQAIDRIVRIIYKITPLSDEPDCILRISRSRSKQRVRLSDGVEVAPGDPLILLHLWNERVPDLIQYYETLDWSRLIIRRFMTSLTMLNTYLSHQSWGSDIVAMRGEFGFLIRLEGANPIAARIGLDLVPLEPPGLHIWRRAFWDNLYSYVLMWAFNPQSLRGKHLAKLVRAELWISRGRLKQLYGTNRIH